MKKKSWILIIFLFLFWVNDVYAKECNKINKDNVVIYFAGDYSDVPYCTEVKTGCNGSNNLCSSGCYPLTIASILASYGSETSPRNVSEYLCSNFPWEAQNREYSTAVTLSDTFHSNFHMKITKIGSSRDNVDDLLAKVDEALLDNKVVMASIRGGKYTSRSHYLALGFKEGDQYYLINTSKRDTTGFITEDDVRENILSVINAGLYTVVPTDCSSFVNTSSSSSNSGRTEDPHPDIFPKLDTSEVDCDTIFMTNGKKNELANFLDDLYLLIKIATPALVLILSTIDYIKAILNSNTDDIKKVHQRTIKRLIIGIIVFFLPYLLDLIFHLFGLYDISRCNIGA